MIHALRRQIDHLRGKRRCDECGRVYPWNKWMPCWEDEKTVQHFAWAKGRCPECGRLLNA